MDISILFFIGAFLLVLLFIIKKIGKKKKKPVFSIDTLNKVLHLDEKGSSTIRFMLTHTNSYYRIFRIKKRKGKFRTISSPLPSLYDLQRKIYQNILIKVAIHPASKGFQRELSIVDNAREHLGNDCIVKVDIRNFFSSIRIGKVISVFRKLGYDYPTSYQLASLCCLNNRLPQGAPTSPVLSNIVCYGLDVQLIFLAKKFNATYTRYADDLTFSGENIPKERLISQIQLILEKEKFVLNNKKTQHIQGRKRKIITGISISSGKMTIPKEKKRELRKNIHYIITRGIEKHQQHINSTDPLYLDRILGYLYFWLSIEPENEYVKNSIAALRNSK